MQVKDKEKYVEITKTINWNYQKLKIGKDEKVVSYISPRTSVNDTEFLQSIDDLLK